MQIQRTAQYRTQIEIKKNIPPVHNKQWQRKRKELVHIRREKSRKCLLIRGFVKRKIFSLNGEIVSRSWRKQIIHHMTYFLWVSCCGFYRVPPSTCTQTHTHRMFHIIQRFSSNLPHQLSKTLPNEFALALLCVHRSSNSGNFSFTTPLTILFWVIHFQRLSGVSVCVCS